MSSLNPGEKFAGYTIERELGAGGMGEVYLVRHPRLPRFEALKVLAPHLSEDPRYRRRFEREADVVAALRHPSIVRVLDRGEDDGRLWISLEYVDGHDLSEHVGTDPLPLPTVARIIEQIARALDAAAAHGLTHRDVKPANILLDTDGQALLVDFGIAHANDQSTVLTGTGVALGTVAFAAPEQLQGLDVDSRADQYALGCTAFALLTGTHLYEGNSAAAIAIAHVRDPIPVATERCPGRVPPAVNPVLTRALAKDPDDRFPDNRAFADALTAALHESSAAPPFAAAPDSQAAPTLRAPAPGTSPAAVHPVHPPPGRRVGGMGTLPRGARPGAPVRPQDTGVPTVPRQPSPGAATGAGPHAGTPLRRPQSPDQLPPGIRATGWHTHADAGRSTARSGAQPAPPRTQQLPSTRPATLPGVPPRPAGGASDESHIPTRRAQPLSPGTSGDRHTDPSPDLRPGRRRGLLLGALAVVFLLVAGVVGARMLTSGDDGSGGGTSASGGPAASRPSVGVTLPDLTSPRTAPSWIWKPRSVGSSGQSDVGIVGGTGKYAVAVSKSTAGATFLSVLDAADGATVRTIALSDQNLGVRRCRQLGDTSSTRMVCFAADNAGGGTSPYVVDLAAGTARKVDASGPEFAVSDTNFVVASESTVYSGTFTGRSFALDNVVVPDAFPPAYGSPVIAVRQQSDGTTTLRRVADGKVVYRFAADSSDASWQPYLNGFVVRKDSPTTPTLTFFDAHGAVTAEISGDWTVPAPSTDNLIPGAIAAVPILLDTTGKRVAGFDAKTGKVRWQKNYQMQTPMWINGYGTKVLLGASASEYESFDCYDGTGGRIVVPRDGTQAGTPMGTDGTRFAILSRPEVFGGPGKHELLVYAPGNPDPLWRMPVTTTRDNPGIAVQGGGKVYAGGGLDFADRRIL